jgi:hypothetical protein
LNGKVVYEISLPHKERINKTDNLACLKRLWPVGWHTHHSTAHRGRNILSALFLHSETPYISAMFMAQIFKRAVKVCLFLYV